MRDQWPLPNLEPRLRSSTRSPASTPASWAIALIDGLALREVVPRNRLANPAASSLPFPRTVADRPALSHRRRWLIRCPIPLEKLAARAFGFSPPVPVSKKSANSRSIADRTAANMAWARSTSAQWPKKKLSAPLCQHLQSKNSPIEGATYSSAACTRSRSIFAIATVPVVIMPMPGMIMRLVVQSPSCSVFVEGPVSAG